VGKLTTVAKKKDIPAGGAKSVTVEGKMIAIFNVDNTYYAIDDTCTHAEGPLSEGSVEGTVVTCPWHGATFDLTNGKVLSAPAFDDVRCYPVKIQGEEIQIELSDHSGSF
jgi:nitrite reductase/ring-hydroxylating ferredoxin subunit